MITQNWTQKILKGDKRTAAKWISLLEERDPKAVRELSKLYPHAGQAFRLGVTGPQGAGKSSVINRLIEAALRKKMKVGVLAVDPTSALTGGAFLGDRVRMQSHTLEKKVFIRSMASRSRHGGLSPALRDSAVVLDALGCDLIFIETIGVGQDEIDITQTADATLLVLSPDFGDKFQALKAGILETCDCVVLNKSDHRDAKTAFSTLQQLIALPAFKVSAKKGTGIPDLFEHLLDLWNQSCQNGTTKERRQESYKAEVREKVEEAMLKKLTTLWSSSSIQKQLHLALKKKKNPNQLVAQLLKQIKIR